MAKSAPDSKQSLLSKLVEAAKTVDSLEATGKNPNFQYPFIEEGNVVAAVRKALYERGVWLRSHMVKADVTSLGLRPDGSSRGNKAIVEMVFTFLDTEYDDSIGFSWVGEANDNGDKAIAKAITSCVKYALLKNFLIPKTGDDPEADGTTDHEAARPSAPTPASARPAPPKAPEKPAEKAPAPAEGEDRKQARLELYEALKGAGKDVAPASIKAVAHEALNRQVKTLFDLSAEDFVVMTTYVYDNYGAAAPTDSDIPF